MRSAAACCAGTGSTSPGSHSLDALLEHIAQRQQESPDYYDRMPDLTGKTSWQQLDTTLCMRVLLDPEKDAAKPLDLLGNTRAPRVRPAAPATRCAPPATRRPTPPTHRMQRRLHCCSMRRSRAWKKGYAGTAFRENELAQYYRQAEDF